MLQAVDLTWRAGDVTIVEGVTFAVGAGECIALMGRNGAGKSTLVDLLAGLRTPSAGSVLLHGRRLPDWSAAERARYIGHLPQLVRTQSSLTVEQIVMMGRYPHSDRWTESDADRAVVERALGRCACLPFRARRLSTLSGGERQRVLLAACVAQDPAVLLLDEPSTFLDIEHQLQTFALLRGLTDAGGACIAVSHDLNLALRFCTRVIVLAHGTVVRDMPIDVARRRDDWLELFSPDLKRLESADGRSWIGYR